METLSLKEDFLAKMGQALRAQNAPAAHSPIQISAPSPWPLTDEQLRRLRWESSISRGSNEGWFVTVQLLADTPVSVILTHLRVDGGIEEAVELNDVVADLLADTRPFEAVQAS